MGSGFGAGNVKSPLTTARLKGGRDQKHQDCRLDPRPEPRRDRVRVREDRFTRDGPEQDDGWGADPAQLLQEIECAQCRQRADNHQGTNGPGPNLLESARGVGDVTDPIPERREDLNHMCPQIGPSLDDQHVDGGLVSSVLR